MSLSSWRPRTAPRVVRLCLVIVALAASPSLHAQTLAGRVTDAETGEALPGASVAVRDCAVSNAGWAFEPVEPGSAPKAVSIRGYAVGNRAAGLRVEISEPGRYELSGSGELRKL